MLPLGSRVEYRFLIYLMIMPPPPSYLNRSRGHMAKAGSRRGNKRVTDLAPHCHINTDRFHVPDGVLVSVVLEPAEDDAHVLRLLEGPGVESWLYQGNERSNFRVLRLLHVPI